MSLFLSGMSQLPFNTTTTESLRKTAYLFRFVFFPFNNSFQLGDTFAERSCFNVLYWRNHVFHSPPGAYKGKPTYLVIIVGKRLPEDTGSTITFRCLGQTSANLERVSASKIPPFPEGRIAELYVHLQSPLVRITFYLEEESWDSRGTVISCFSSPETSRAIFQGTGMAIHLVCEDLQEANKSLAQNWAVCWACLVCLLPFPQLLEPLLLRKGPPFFVLL